MNSISVRTLSCGMTLVVEKMTGVRSASVSWAVPAGCITDPDEREGITPLLEEMLLRGSGQRDSRQEADLFDSLGANRDVEAGTYTMRFAATCVGERMVDVLGLGLKRRPWSRAGICACRVWSRSRTIRSSG